MDKITLPDGGWAVLRDPADVTERQRRPLVRLQQRLLGSDVGAALIGAQGDIPKDEALELIRPQMASDDFDMVAQLDDLLLVTLLDSWSYDGEITADSVLDLPGKVRTVLLEACKPLLGPLLGETSDADVLDPASPTVPANGSDRP